MKRITELDALRGIAILIIMLFHYFSRYNYIYGHQYRFFHDFYWGGYTGIYLFFVISGFSIMISLKKTNRALDFMVNRFSRLYPSYWVSMFSTFIAVSVFSLPGREITVREFLANLSMLQYWQGIPDVDGAYWILPIFLIFYAFIFLLLIAKKTKYIEVVGLLWIIFSFVLRYFNFPYKETIESLVGFFKYSHLFFAGILFYQLKIKGFTFWRNLLILLCFLVQLSSNKTGETIALGIILATFYLLIFNYLFLIKNQLLTWIGKISYPLFLIHANIGYIIIRKLYSIQAHQWLIWMVPTLVSFLLAIIIHYYVAKPAQLFIRNSYNTLKKNN
ncbi:acyltransferase family protein [Patescibacteria group bacterium]